MVSVASRVTNLTDWLTHQKSRLEQLGYQAGADFWEPFLKELGGYRDEAACNLFKASSSYGEFRHSFHEGFWHYAHERDLRRSAAMVASYQARGSIDRLSSDLRNYLERESAMVARHGGNRGSLISVGCGAAPETLLFYHHLFDQLKCFGLDIDPVSARLSQKRVDALGNGTAKILCGDGSNFDYRGFSTIHIANYVSPKKRVLEEVVRTASPGALIIIRTPKMLESLICEEFSGLEVNDLYEIDREISQYCQMDSICMKLRGR
jgi:SAM-dependent methyltransferase